MDASTSPLATAAVCTFRRDDPLRHTISQLIDQNDGSYEILVIDQKADHDQTTASFLDDCAARGHIRYLKTDEAGLTRARNQAARESRSNLLLFCDDDVVLGPDWAKRHIAAYQDVGVAAVAGQVLHAGEVPTNKRGEFSYNLPLSSFTRLYGANFSIRKSAYNSVGGSDENLGVHSYTEDVILAKKLISHGLQIRYDPTATVLHLQWPRGGCRIADDTQPTQEWEKSYSRLYWMFLSPPQTGREYLSRLWEAVRNGPVRRNMVVNFWKQPIAWHGFFKALIKAKRDASNERTSDGKF
jgi:GT2 family glycosyltransferase